MVRKKTNLVSISDTCTLILENCKVPVENVLKGSGKGFPIGMNALDNSRIGIAAQALGIAQGAYEAALKYSQERETFGVPIGRHQLITGYLADMATRIEAARLLVYKASWAKEEHYENGGTRHTKEASMSKLLLEILRCGFQKEQFKFLVAGFTKNSQLRDSSEMLRSLKYEGTQKSRSWLLLEH